MTCWLCRRPGLGSVHTSTHFYFNLMNFPTTVHMMSNASEWYVVSSVAWYKNQRASLKTKSGATPGAVLKVSHLSRPQVAWQRNFVHRHRGRLLPSIPTTSTPERLIRQSALGVDRYKGISQREEDAIEVAFGF